MASTHCDNNPPLAWVFLPMFAFIGGARGGKLSLRYRDYPVSDNQFSTLACCLRHIVAPQADVEKSFKTDIHTKIRTHSPLVLDLSAERQGLDISFHVVPIWYPAFSDGEFDY